MNYLRKLAPTSNITARNVFGPLSKWRYKVLPNKIKEKKRTFQRLKHKMYDPSHNNDKIPHQIDSTK